MNTLDNILYELAWTEENPVKAVTPYYKQVRVYERARAEFSELDSMYYVLLRSIPGMLLLPPNEDLNS